MRDSLDSAAWFGMNDDHLVGQGGDKLVSAARGLAHQRGAFISRDSNNR
jgi:hypothetical protein